MLVVELDLVIWLMVEILGFCDIYYGWLDLGVILEINIDNVKLCMFRVLIRGLFKVN